MRANNAKLKVARGIELPTQTEVMVSCRTTKGTKYFGTPHAMAQPADNSWQYAEDGLVIGSSLVAPAWKTHSLSVMNLSDELRNLYEGGLDQEVYPVTSLKQAMGTFQ